MTTDTNQDRAARAADYYRLDEQLTDDELAIRDRVRAFGENEVLPVINDYWERAEFPFELVPKLAELGVAGTTIDGYGCPGMSRLAAGIVSRELARADGSLNTFFGVHSGLAMGTINLLGSDEQRSRWLPPMARLELIGAFALTEPQHGSDSVSLETEARRDGDSYILNGAKRWIGNASFADLVIVWARDADGDVGAYVVEKGTPGFDPSTVIGGKIGKRAVWQAEIALTDVRVPAENKLADARTFEDATRVLDLTRGGAAWECVGHAMAGVEAAVAYAGERTQFGQPIAGFQLVQAKLATMVAETTAMQLICLQLVRLQEDDAATGAMASLAKLHNARKAKLVCSEARDIMGGNGLLLEYHVARHLTDLEIVETYEGTDSVQSLILGRDLTGLSAFT
ncbi:MAG TPA: acyl-CoA dehydrogenase family protein [Solirubrobacteraceae bacterium]|jgi:glutaryl-CoA dehydrogenase|nr:acyl-CoA dehydrogenase family protein [Solirubrobacteraceae bacterium]